MKPKRIILVRHGESVANVDAARRETIPDYKMDLTDIGTKQAKAAGQEIAKLIGNESVTAYISPYYRTRQTFAGISSAIDGNVLSVVEDPRIREQDWGHLKHPDEAEETDRARDDFGVFYYRIEDGESVADVFDRVSTFLETMHRDFEKSNFADNCLVVTHGMTLRVFLMRWLHWTVEEFEVIANPKNCQVVVLAMTDEGKYVLESALAKRNST
jgi:broad specificity phosphatase PhoE